MIAEHMADRVAQGVYNYMKQMLKMGQYNEGVASRLIGDSCVSLKLMVTPDDIISIRCMVVRKFEDNVEVTALADMVSGMGGRIITKKEQAVKEASKSFSNLVAPGMVPPRMPAMMPTVAAKQETAEASMLKTLKIGFIGKMKEITSQLAVIHGSLYKAFDLTKVDANLEVLVAQGKLANGKLPQSVIESYDMEQIMSDLKEEMQEVFIGVSESIETLRSLSVILEDKQREIISEIDGAIAEL